MRLREVFGFSWFGIAIGPADWNPPFAVPHAAPGHTVFTEMFPFNPDLPSRRRYHLMAGSSWSVQLSRRPRRTASGDRSSSRHHRSLNSAAFHVSIAKFKHLSGTEKSVNALPVLPL
jgi:hypothetical protein